MKCSQFVKYSSHTHTCQEKTSHAAQCAAVRPYPLATSHVLLWSRPESRRSVYLRVISTTLLFTKQFALAAEKEPHQGTSLIVWPANYASNSRKSIYIYFMCIWAYKYRYM